MAAPPPSLALLTDRYELSMLVGYVRSGMAGRRATCELYIRRLPPSRRFMLFAGLERALRSLLDLRFSDEDLAWLRAEPAVGPAITPEVERFLRDFRFRGDVSAMPEGTVAFPDEPLLRVRAALPEAQVVETLLLSIVNHDARVASKAARCVLAAGARPCWEFGSRRTHERAAVDAARAAYVAGFAGTSNEEAGRRHGIPVSGTCAHMWMLAFVEEGEEGEEAAFRAFHDVYPGAILLVDTFETERGIERAIAVAGERLAGVRLDSGDLAALSIRARARLDRAGLGKARVIASGDLNEYAIRALDARGARIDGFGIGTDVVATPDAPALGAIYKLVEVEGRSGEPIAVAKRSAGKATFPGAKQVFRSFDARGRMAGDEIALEAEERREARPLLVDWIRDGALVREIEPLAAVRERALAEIAALPEEMREIPSEPPGEPPRAHYPVARSAALDGLFRAAVAGRRPAREEVEA